MMSAILSTLHFYVNRLLDGPFFLELVLKVPCHLMDALFNKRWSTAPNSDDLGLRLDLDGLPHLEGGDHSLSDALIWIRAVAAHVKHRRLEVAELLFFIQLGFGGPLRIH
jgi:hypothetical protein